jgi:hypothetical protein
MWKMMTRENVLQQGNTHLSALAQNATEHRKTGVAIFLVYR